MNKITLYIVGIVVILLILSPEALVATSTTAARAAYAKNKIPGSNNFPKGEKGKICVLSAFEIDSIAKKMGYEVESIHENFREKNALTWRVRFGIKDGSHEDEIRIGLFIGYDSSESAQELMFSDMANMSMPITRSTFGRLDNGPGEVCLTWLRNIKRDDEKIEGSIWFFRNSVAVSIRCSGDTDLLPIARAIDDDIKACPIIGVNDLVKELPDLEVKEPAVIKTEPKVRYRVEYEVVQPLEKWQRVVTCKDNMLVEVKEFDSYIEVTPREGAQLPEICIGVYDSKKMWVKWHNETNSVKDVDEPQ